MRQQLKHLYEFGPYRIDPGKRILWRGDDTISLPNKVFDTLLVLVEQGQEVVSKDDLMKAVWPDSFVEESNLSQSIFLLRKALGETAQDSRYIVTVPGRGYRFAETVREISQGDDVFVESHSVHRLTVEQTEIQPRKDALTSFSWRLRQRPWNWLLGAGAMAAVVALASVVYLRMHRPPALNEADLVLVSDFANTTGEPVFDDALKQALSVKLAESPYFNVVPDSETRRTLVLMGRSPDERVVPPIARDACQRAGAKVVVGGSILGLGDKYVLDLNAINCLTGTQLAHEEIKASNREQVLRQLGQLIPSLRSKLGESVGSIQKFDTPIEQATTKSLPALKAYASGDKKRTQGQEAESIPFYKMAIELDPDFAMAYARLGTVYGNLNQPDLAGDYLHSAFERREHVSEREKFYIQAHYYENATREIDKANDTFKLWTEVYPHDFLPTNSLSSGYVETGQLDKAIEAGQQALRLNPNHALAYASLSRAYERATHFAEAKAICERAIAEKIDSSWTHQVLYRIAFVESDDTAMQREIDWFKGKPQESVSTYLRAKAALSLGELRNSRELFQHARDIAFDRQLKELGVAIINGQAQFDAEVGDSYEARALADLSLRTMPASTRHNAFAALALARAGDSRRAEILLNDLNKRPNLGTALNNVVFPSVRAAIELDRGNPAAAIEELRPALPYDLGTDAGGTTLYYRGLAYLEMKSGKEATAQFQKILDNRGVVAIDVYWPLAHLGLARACAMIGDVDKSLAHYREFLSLWKNADPDLRILTQAKTEYTQLSSTR